MFCADSVLRGELSRHQVSKEYYLVRFCVGVGSFKGRGCAGFFLGGGRFGEGRHVFFGGGEVAGCLFGEG